MSADGRPYGGMLEYAYNKGIVDDVADYLRTAGHVEVPQTVYAEQHQGDCRYAGKPMRKLCRGN